MSEHGAVDAIWDNIGRQWVITCNCGFAAYDKHLGAAGEWMDVHLWKSIPTYPEPWHHPDDTRDAPMRGVG